MISALKVRKLLCSRCIRFLANMVDPRKEMKLTSDNVPMVRDYVSVFPKDLPGLPSN